MSSSQKRAPASNPGGSPQSKKRNSALFGLAAKRFLARLSLEMHGLHQDQVIVIFRATISNWYSTTDKADKIRASKLFESAHTWVESRLIEKLQSYSKLWYASAAGAQYHKDWHHAKRQKNATKYHYPRPPSSDQEVLTFNKRLEKRLKKYKPG